MSTLRSKLSKPIYFQKLPVQEKNIISITKILTVDISSETKKTNHVKLIISLSCTENNQGKSLDFRCITILYKPIDNFHYILHSLVTPGAFFQHF